MRKGVALGFLAYALFSCGDAGTKALSGSLPVFEISFFAGCFAALTVFLFLRPPGERWRDMFRMRHPRLVLLRTVSGTCAGISGIYAFTTLPFAEAYALIFLAPAFVTLISIFFLGEEVGWRRWLAIAIGFAGVLLVVRPGFHQLSPGHLAALLAGAATAVTITVLRRIGKSERRVSLVGVAILGSMVVSGLLMSFDFRPPKADDFLFLGLSGTLAGLGQLGLMAATRLAPANRVAPAQYGQVLWAVILGAVFYREFPDTLALAGMALVALSGLFTFLREDQVTGWTRRVFLVRERS